MKMKALRSFGIPNANEGHVRRGREFTVASPARAKELELAGLAYPIPEMAMKMEPPALNKMMPSPENKAAHAGPLPSVGGETGAGDAPSSSPPDHPQRRRRSTRSRDEDLLS